MSTSKILKHRLALTRVQAIDVPAGSRPLSAALQPTCEGGAQIVLWTIGPEHGPTTRLRVMLMNTGHEVSTELVDSCDFVAAVQWIVARRDEDGTVEHRPMVEHVWIERETPSRLN